jgi:hypothetical protein
MSGAVHVDGVGFVDESEELLDHDGNRDWEK